MGEKGKACGTKGVRRGAGWEGRRGGEGGEGRKTRGKGEDGEEEKAKMLPKAYKSKHSSGEKPEHPSPEALIKLAKRASLHFQYDFDMALIDFGTISVANAAPPNAYQNRTETKPRTV